MIICCVVAAAGTDRASLRLRARRGRARFWRAGRGRGGGAGGVARCGIAPALSALRLVLRLVAALLRRWLLVATRLALFGLLFAGLLRSGRRRRARGLRCRRACGFLRLVALVGEAIEDQDNDGDSRNGGEHLLRHGG